MEEATILVRVIQFWRYPPQREDKICPEVTRKDSTHDIKSNVNIFERPLHSSTTARLSERIRRRPDGKLFSAYQTAFKIYCFLRTIMFSSRPNQRTASISIPKNPEVASALPGSPRDSLSGQATSHPRPKKNSISTSDEMERSARDLTRTDLELLLNLVRSETRPCSEASSRHPSRTANAKTFSDASVQMQTSSQRRLQSLRRRHKVFAPYAPSTTSPRTRSLRQELRERHDCWASEKTRDHWRAPLPELHPINIHQITL